MNNEEKILQMLEKQGQMLEVLTERVEEIDQRSIRTQVLLETDYHDKLQLLYDGHSAIMEKLEELAPKDRVEVLEDEIITLKTVVKAMSKRLTALEKAQ